MLVPQRTANAEDFKNVDAPFTNKFLNILINGNFSESYEDITERVHMYIIYEKSTAIFHML